MRVHMGCGSVYLKGWFNVDLPGPNTFLAEQRPDLVDRWGTTDDDYYGRHRDKTKDKLAAGPLKQEWVCDRFGDFSNIPVPSWEGDELLARHVFEHLSITEAHKALDQIDSVLKPNAILRLDVPDHEETLKLYRETGDEFYVRHLLGPRRSDYGYHMMSYTRERLRALVEEHGFVFVAEEPNIHFYPAFCLRFVKPGPRAPVEYVELPYSIPADWNVAEVGPGNFPFERANVYIDHDPKRLVPLKEKGKIVYEADLELGLPRIEHKQFDFVWISHCLEHVSNIQSCVDTLNRISKRGVAVVPSFAKEAVGWWEERDHRWICLPHPVNGRPPVFIRKNSDFIDKLSDPGLQKISCHLFRTGPNRMGESERYARKWYYEKEACLDLVIKWDDQHPLKISVIE